MISAAPELIIHNGAIHTLDSELRVVNALAARGGRIVALGDNPNVLALADAETYVVDIQGGCAIPGIIDSHCHADARAARLANWHDLGPERIETQDQLLNVIAQSVATQPHRTWFAGYRYNERKSGGYPTMAQLNDVSPHHPVFILRTDGHLGLANQSAFEMCDIATDASDPPFGRYDRDPNDGAFTGLVRETAAHVFLERIHAEDTPRQLADAMPRVIDEFLSYGVTSIYNSLVGTTGIQAYQLLRERGALKFRVGLIISGRESGLVDSYIRAGIRSGFGDEFVRVIGVEWCPDCSTSGRTAAYYEPYVGEPALGEPADNTGMLLYEADDLTRRAGRAHQAGLQVMIEGVGDRGIDFALDVIESALRAHPVRDHRMRVEHCCYVTPDIRARIKRLGVIDSSATGFMYELGDAYVDNRGEAAMRHMWPHRTLIDSGIVAPGHSDAWVCSPNPFTAMWSMVHRQTDSGRSLDAREATTPLEALQAYTTLAAYSGREEKEKGSLEVGKLADVAVLDRNMFTVPASQLRDVQVKMTVVGGEICFERD
ncbi:MAG: amidohydrolase [Pseudomonadota bacterium]